MDEVSTWLLDWFAGRGEVPGATPEERLAVSYFDAKLIDSMSVVELLEAVEARFAMRFSEADFQDRRFFTIGGLATLVRERRP